MHELIESRVIIYVTQISSNRYNTNIDNERDEIRIPSFRRFNEFREITLRSFFEFIRRKVKDLGRYVRSEKIIRRDI